VNNDFIMMDYTTKIGVNEYREIFSSRLLSVASVHRKEVFQLGTVMWCLEIEGSVTFTASAQHSAKDGRKTRTRRLPKQLPKRVLERIAREEELQLKPHENVITNGPKGHLFPVLNRKRQRDCEEECDPERKRLKQDGCFSVEEKLESLRRKWNPDGSLSMTAIAALKKEYTAKVKLARTEAELTELHTLEVLMREQQQQKSDTEDTRNTNVAVSMDPGDIPNELVVADNSDKVPPVMDCFPMDGFPVDVPMLYPPIVDEMSFNVDLEMPFTVEDALVPKKEEEFDVSRFCADWNLPENTLMPEVLDWSFLDTPV
jgi:hypothetical protein